MSSTLPRYRRLMIIHFRTRVEALVRQMELGKFDWKKFDPDLGELSVLGSDILMIFYNGPARLGGFRQAVGRLVEACCKEGRPESVEEVFATCYRSAQKVLDDELLWVDVPEPVAEPEPVAKPELIVSPAEVSMGDVVAPDAPVELLPSPPWRKGIAPAVEKCLLVYIAGGKEIAMAALGGKYKNRPDKLAGLVRNEIDKAMKSPVDPFVPKEGRVPVGKSAGGTMRIEFNGDENSTKRGRKPREP